MPNKNRPLPPTVPLELWDALYNAAARFQTLAPWQWMSDAEVFGVNNQYGVRMVSIMGELGEVFGLVSYRGSTGVSSLLQLLNGEVEPEDPGAIYQQDSVLADFVPLKELGKVERAIIQQVGFQAVASKPKLYPQFKSYKPGYVPWYVDEGEARLLLDDLDKAVHFAELVRKQPDLFESHPTSEFPFLPATITAPLTLDQIEWRTVFANPPAPDPLVQPQAFDLAPLAKLPQLARSTWELVSFYSDMSIGEPPRPYYSKIGLGVDAKSGMVLGFMLSGVHDTLSEAAARGLVQSIQATGFRPEAVKTDSLRLTRTLAPIAAALGIKILHAKTLPMAEEARRALEAFAG